MHIDKYKQEDGWYKDNDGFSYETAEDFIQIGILGFCGCGIPEESLIYVKNVLQHVDNLKQLVWEKKWTYEQWKQSGKQLFINTGSEYFAYYVLTELDLMEHGGSVPGWLTKAGHELLEDLIEYEKDNKAASADAKGRRG